MAHELQAAVRREIRGADLLVHIEPSRRQSRRPIETEDGPREAG